MKQQNVELLQTLYEEYQGALRYTATRIGVNSDDVDDCEFPYKSRVMAT